MVRRHFGQKWPKAGGRVRHFGGGRDQTVRRGIIAQACFKRQRNGSLCKYRLINLLVRSGFDEWANLGG
jgi:hypothetical protein